jgi:hypothetical protein
VSERSVVVVDPQRDQPEDSAEQHGEKPEALSRPIPTPSPLGDEDKRRVSGSSEGHTDAEKEALRRELDAEWERTETENPITENGPRTPPHSQPRALEYNVPQRPPPLYQHQQISRPGLELASLTLEEQIDRLGLELHQARSAAHTPMSQTSHHSDADVLSAQAIRYERPSGSTSTLQITPIATPPALRSGNNKALNFGGESGSGGSNIGIRKSIDFRSESNLRGSGNNTPSRRVRAMVEEFESKSSREASPAASPVRGSPSRGSPTRGSPTRGR